MQDGTKFGPYLILQLLIRCVASASIWYQKKCLLFVSLQ